MISYHKHKLNPILVHYIYHTNEKGKPCEMDLPLLKDDITNILGHQKRVIYSRYMQSGFVTDLLEISEILTFRVTSDAKDLTE